MSERLVVRVARSKHPLLVQSFVARDVLQEFAVCVNAKREEEHGDRTVWPSRDEVAEACQRSTEAVRQAVNALKAAGLLVDTGARRGATLQVVVYEVVADLLDGHRIETRPMTGALSRGSKGPDDLGPFGAGKVPDDRGGNPPDDRGERSPMTVVVPTPLIRKEPGRNLEGNLEAAAGGSGDASATPPPPPEEANPAEPAAAAADADREKAWDLWSRMLKGRRESANEAERSLIDDAVTRYGLEHTRDAIASMVDVRKRPPASWVRDRAKKAHDAGGQPGVRRTRGGVELGPPRYELDTNPDGSLRW